MGPSVWKSNMLVRSITIPFGICLYVKDKDFNEFSVPFLKVTEPASGLISLFKAPADIKGIVLFDSYYLCLAVINACRKKRFYFISTLKNNRNFMKRG